LKKISTTIDADVTTPRPFLKTMSVIVDGATLAVVFDWLMEPVAIHLGYWSWGGTGEIPIFNYACWFIFSMLFLLVFHFCSFDKQNKFALHLLLIQIMFFSLLRTFL
jgi:putative membrane protein